MLRTWKRIAALHAVSPGQPRRPLRTGALFYRTLHLIIDDEAFLYFCEHVKEYAGVPVTAPDEEESRLLPKVRFPVGC